MERLKAMWIIVIVGQGYFGDVFVFNEVNVVLWMKFRLNNNKVKTLCFSIFVIIQGLSIQMSLDGFFYQTCHLKKNAIKFKN